MREILFRGKTTGIDGHKKGEWVYGNVVFMDRDYRKKDAVIFPYSSEIAHGDIWGDIYWVDSDTVDQFTGLIDKNGKRIFGGDVLKTEFGRLCTVAWFSSRVFCGWDLKPIGTFENCVHTKPPTYANLLRPDCLEIVGNVYDNFESLEVK